MSIKSKYLVTFLVVLLIIVPAIFLGRDVAAPAVWRAKVEELNLDTSPGSVGSGADGTVPVVETLAEMEENDRFVLQAVEVRTLGGGGNYHTAGGQIGGVHYSAATLTDGTVIAAQVNEEFRTSALIPGEDYYAKEHRELVTYPVGTLRPWPDETARAEAEGADWLTCKTVWLDARGDFGAELPDFEKIQYRYTVGFGIGGLVLGIALCMAIEAKLERKAGRNQP